MMNKKEFFNHIGDLNRYSLLARMEADCRYVIYASHGCKCAYKYLWAGNPQEQIAYMRYLLESFPEEEKPVWIDESKIDEYEAELMKEVVA